MSDPDLAAGWARTAQLGIDRADLVEAVAAGAAAVRLAPDVAGYRYIFGRALKAAGRLEEAVAQYVEALRLAPAAVDTYVSLGIALRMLGRLGEAEGALHRALALDPNHREARRSFAKLRYLLGARLQNLGRSEPAFHQFAEGVRLDPSHFDCAMLAGNMAAAVGREEEATRHFDHALGLRPSDAARINRALLMPAVFQSVEEITERREHYTQALDTLKAGSLRVDNPADIVDCSFYFAYHGVPNRDLHCKRAALFQSACPQLAWRAPHCAGWRGPGARIKVGFLSRFMYGHSIGKTTAGLVAELSRERFEVHTLFMPPTIDDETSRFIRARSDQATSLDFSFEAARRQIAALELDVLFFQDVGMDPGAFHLALARLAPVQCVSFGHPDTTGSPEMDWFVSNDLFEPPGAAEHYSERLFLLRDLPTLAYYYRPEAAGELSREQLGFTPAQHLYLCPQNLFKLHPDFDRLIGGILRRDPHGVVVLIQSGEHWTAQLRQRFARTLSDVAPRIAFVGHLQRKPYLRLLELADVQLDTLHFNGMNTSLEAFAAGTPVVTLPAALQRGRHTQAMYRKMEIAECIAGDEEDYVDIAVRLGTEQDYGESVRRKILERNRVLFEDRRVVQEFERFFEEAVGEAAEKSRFE